MKSRITREKCERHLKCRMDPRRRVGPQIDEKKSNRCHSLNVQLDQEYSVQHVRGLEK